MSKIYIASDTHGLIDFDKVKNLKSKKIIKKDDTLIIAGDFGLVWGGRFLKETEWWLKWIDENFPCNILFVDGNHEDFDLLYSKPIEFHYGNNIRRVSKKVFHLLRGHIYNILKFKIFVFGGAHSIDKASKVEGVSWWPQEIPTKAEEDLGLTNLEKVNNKVDYIITHESPINVLSSHHPESYGFKRYLKHISSITEFNTWFFGHHHIDILLEVDKKLYQGVYKDVICISKKGINRI